MEQHLPPARGPRVTPADIEAEIASEHYFTAADGVAGAAWREVSDARAVSQPLPLHLLTFCVLILRNGFTVTGHSACASADNFDAEVGCKIARANAVEQMWKLLGFRLVDRMHSDLTSHGSR